MRTDITYLEEMASGNTDLMLEMIDLFKDQIEEIRQEMIRLHDTQDYYKLGKLFHKAKGTVSIVGMTELANDLKEYEENTKELKQKEVYATFISDFINQTKEAESELQMIAENLQ